MNNKTADITANKQRGRPFKPGQSGNLKGRPPGTAYIGLLEEAIHEVETEKKKSFFKRVIERAYISDSVMIAVLRKFISDKTYTQVEEIQDRDKIMSEAGETLKKKLDIISKRYVEVEDMEETGKGNIKPEKIPDEVPDKVSDEIPQKVRIEKATGTVVIKDPGPDKSITIKGKYGKFDSIRIK